MNEPGGWSIFGLIPPACGWAVKLFAVFQSGRWLLTSGVRCIKWDGRWESSELSGKAGSGQGLRHSPFPGSKAFPRALSFLPPGARPHPAGHSTRSGKGWQMSCFWKTDLHRKVGFCDNVYIHLSVSLLMLLNVTLTSNTSVQQAYMLPSAALRNKCGSVILRTSRNVADKVQQPDPNY